MKSEISKLSQRPLNQWKGNRFARHRRAIGMAATAIFLCLASPFLDRECLGSPQDASGSISDKDRKFFESTIRPILVEHCYACHSKESGLEEGGLRLDTRERSRRGGGSGPAVVPGDTKSSLLIRAVRHQDDELIMPPVDAGEKLSGEQIQSLERWIRSGAADPRDEFEGDEWNQPYQSAKSWWAFQPISVSQVPSQVDTSWCETDIDRFLWSGYRTAGLKPVPDAQTSALLRRVYFDLIGLPPTIAEIQAFDQLMKEGKSISSALEVVVDSLLSSEQFGVHWGRHWLDVARFAESAGRDVNVAFPHAWRYRDYVIESFNRNTPYDQFLREQIAGDLLESDNNEERSRQTIATGFLAIGSKSINERNPRQFAVDLADEQIDTVFQSTMGLTVACARCHDHKFDPIPQKDYAAVAGIFLSTETKYGTTGGPQVRNPSSLVELPSDAATSSKPMDSKSIAAMKARLTDLKKQAAELAAERRRDRRNGNDAGNNPQLLRTLAQIGDLESELSSHRSDGSAKALAMAVSDKSKSIGRPDFQGRRNRSAGFDSILDSPLFVRGDISKASASVPRGMPNLFENHPSTKIASTTSGRRELAEWIVSPNNPMTARVAVNRIWYWLHGQGIVSSLDNFGLTGGEPTHPELLDHLASQYIESGWNTKALIKQIVLSHSYRLSTAMDDSNHAIDPDNRMNWRSNRRRLTGEAIRDAMLSASGTLDGRLQSGSMIAQSGDGVIGGPRDRGIAENRIVQYESNVRSIYLPLPRTVVPESLEVFDLPDASAVQTLRETTNVPAQSLYLLNSRTVHQQAKEMADRILESYPGKDKSDDFGKRLEMAFQLCFSRPPSSDENLSARRMMAKLPNDAKAAWTSLAKSLFATAEFRYID